LGSYPANPVQHPELNPELADMKSHLELIIAFVNPRSGGQKGRIVLERLKNYLHKDNVFDLTKGGPKPGLEKHKHKNNLKIIACGGDGTVGWVLSVLDEMDFGDNLPAVSILPLGTGNDLARTLGWGGGYNNESMELFLNKVINGSVVQLDRWTIKTDLIKYRTPSLNNEKVGDDKSQTSRRGSKSSETHSTAKAQLPLTVINNYFSIGADSKIALDFHEAREKNPEQFTSQAFNKIEYVKNYNRELFNQSCKNIIQSIKVLECDGVDCLPKIQEMNCHSIVIVNIPSYMAGKKPWKNGEEGFSDQSYSDGKLEIVGFQTADFVSFIF
jgi:diacylglycerol kinase (ATP)